MAVHTLSATQRRHLKRLAHHLKPLLQLGKDGPSPQFLSQLAEQLAAHELLKMRVLNNCEFTAEEIETPIRRHGVAIVQKVGHIYTLFKQREKNSRVELPAK